VLLQFLVIVIDTFFQGAGVSAVVGGSLLDVIFSRSVHVFLEDGVGVSGLEFGLEVAESLGAGVGSTASVAEVVAVVLTFLAITAPVALPTALLLHSFRISISVTVFGEVARKTFFWEGGTIGDGTVVAIVSFVGTGHGWK